MRDRLVLFLAADGEPSWIAVGANGQPAGRVMTDDAERLKEAAAGKEVIAVVPAETVLLTSTVLPKLSRARLLQALPFAIEDQLTSDVETLHFAPATTQPDGTTPVAVVALDHMQQWQAKLQAWHVQADSIIPSIFALPIEEGAWHVSITNMAVARTGDYSGFSCEVAQLKEWLTIAISSATKKPRKIYIHNYTPQASDVALSNVEIVEDTLPADQWYQDAARQLDSPSINLLSGSFTSRKAKYPQMTKVRKMVSYLAVVWLVLLLLYPVVSYVMLKSRLSNIQGQMWVLYKKQFPHATSMVAPKVRFEDKLHKAGSTLGQNKFLLLLAYTGEALHKSSNVTIKRMIFQSNLLTLDVTAEASGFSTFTSYLSQQGLQVKQQNANVSGEHVSATIQVE